MIDSDFFPCDHLRAAWNVDALRNELMQMRPE